MKKRVLSFLVACVMVVSTFIISKPLVHVHAVEDETNFVEGENQWTMPYNWHENLDKDAAGKYDLASKQNGIWRLTSFSNPDDFATMTWNDTHERSYVESVVNRGIGSGASAAVGWTGWYISARHRWNGGSIFSKGDNSTWMKVAMTTVKNGTYQIDENGEYVLVKDSKVEKGIGYVDSYSKNPAVVFTAPENGTYSYSELVTANNLLDDSNLIDARDTAKRFAVNVTVRKEGKVIDSFLLDEDQESKTLEGTVSLAKGERLAFVFSLATDDAKLGKDSTAETSRYALKLSDVVVKKVSDSVAVGTTWNLPTDFYTCNPGAGEKINGNWQLASYDITTQKTYYNFGAAGSTHSATSWYFDCKDPIGGQYGSFTYYANGIKVNPGSDTYPYVAAAILFTAPDDGVYEFDADTFTYGTNKDKTGSRTNIFYVMKDGVIYDITSPKYNADHTENMTGTITLKKGEKIYFCVQRYTKYTKAAASGDWPDWIGARFEGLSVEKVAELDAGYDFVTKYTFAPDGTSLAFGQFEMKAYDFTTKTVSDAVLTTGESWSVKAASGNSLFWKSSAANSVVGWGPDGSTTNANEGAAIVFTAPVTGTYNITGHFEKTYVKSANGKHYCDYKIILADGTVVFDGTNYDESTAATFNNLSHTLGGSVELDKGEKVYIVKSPNASAVVGAQGGEIYALTVAQIGDVCEGKHTFVDGVCTECDYECANHAWANAEGTCTVCGASHTHNGGEAICNKGAICDTCKYVYTDVAADNHDWSKNNGVCANCGTGCPAHDMKNAEGKCATCGMSHTHDVTADDATCQKAAVCSICGYEVAPVNADKHGEISYVANENKTHKVVCEFGCVIDEDAACVLDENNVCKDCKYDYTVEIAADNFSEVFDSVFNGGETDHVAEGPAEGALNNSGAVKGEDVNGFTYGGFNLEMNETIGNTVKLRHHILLDGNLTVKVNGEEVVLTNVSGNYYYFEVEVEIGKFSEAHTITVGETTVVTASVHSYMKTAFEADEKNPDALTDAQENLLKALYDWDYAVANK